MSVSCSVPSMNSLVVDNYFVNFCNKHWNVNIKFIPEVLLMILLQETTSVLRTHAEMKGGVRMNHLASSVNVESALPETLAREVRHTSIFVNSFIKASSIKNLILDNSNGNSSQMFLHSMTGTI